MKRQNLFAGIALSSVLLLGLMQFPLPLCYAQPWSRLELAGGGVAEDIQYLCQNNPSATNNEVWSACMDAGLYRAEWSGTAWGDWIEYLPGRGMLGVDAVEDAAGVVHVLGGANSRGVWYGRGSPPPQAVWLRPNDADYPTTWKEVRILDVAFYRNASGFPPIPQQQYFAMLYGPPPTGVKPGIYRWDATLITPNFVRVDAAQPTDPARYFYRFCRELDGAGHPDVLYALLRAGDISPVIYDGGLYKLQGTTYAGVSCSEVLITDDQNNYNIKDVYGFSQWKQDANTFWSYLLARWNDGSEDHVSVFATTELPSDDHPTWTKLGEYDGFFDLGGAQDWTEYGVYAAGGMVGRPSLDGHNLWITGTSEYGMLYDDTDTTTSVIQINGTHPTDLKRWHIHSMTSDYDHMESVGSDGMVAFVGTHKQGVWRFQHAPGSVAQWQRLGGRWFSNLERILK